MADKIDKALEVFKVEFNDAGGKAALIQDILNLSKEAAAYDPEEIADEEGDPRIDIRLGYEPEWSDRSRFIPRGFHVMTGLSDFDQIHYSTCGASSVWPDMTREDAESVAEDLVDQVEEMLAEMASYMLPEDWDPNAEESDED